MTNTNAIQATQIEQGLAQFSGTTVYFEYPLNHHVVYTEGMQYLAEKANAYWLIDAIGSYYHPGNQQMLDAIRRDERLKTLQFWRLERLPGHPDEAMLTARADSDCEPFVEQHIEYTDFPLESIDVWAGLGGEQRWVLYLPSEH